MGFTNIIGIDPGQKGGIASLWSDQYTVAPLTCIASKDLPIIKELVSKGSIVYIEQVHAMPAQGVSSSFTFGRNLGYIEGLIWAQGIKEIRYVNPRVWQKIVACEGIKERVDRKQRLIKKAQELFPNVNLMRTVRTKVPDSGMADALLIAYAALKLLEHE